MINKFDSKHFLKAKMIKFGKLCKVQGGFAFKSTWYKGDGIPLVRISSLVNGIVQFDEKTVFLDPSLLKEYSDFTLKKGDTLIAMSGATTGKMAVYSDNQEALLNQRVGRFKLLSDLPVDPKYISYLVNQIRDRVLKDAYGAAQPNISPKQIEEIEVPYFPLNEQQLIVSEIEKQFSRLDEAVASLRRIQSNLKRYKAAVLKAAVEGKLTEQWRKDHPAIEPADQFLKRILTERRTKWETEELAKMKAKGIKPKDVSWKKKYKEPAVPDTANLPELPEGWVWTNFEQLAEASPNALKAGPFGSALKKEYYVPNGYKVYGQEQVISGDPFYGDYYIDQDRFDTLKSCAVKSGDILISLVGTIGKVLILPEDIEPGIINPRLVKLSMNKSYVIPEFVKAYLQSDAVRHSFSTRSHGGTMDILNLSMLKELPVPLPPITEQKLLIENIESSFSIAEELETTIETNLKRAERLRQTILQQAFSGGLVS